MAHGGVLVKAKAGDAVARAVELATIPMREVPLPALFYARFLCDLVGMCGETFISAYATYAQVVEGLSCDDPLYALTDQHRAWYEAAQRDYVLVGMKVRRKACAGPVRWR